MTIMRDGIAPELIYRSVTHNEIVHARWSDELAAELWLDSDDSVENGDVAEYWGAVETGAQWRVHLHREATS